MAGIVDGEGSIGLRWRQHRYVMPILQVTNTRLDLLEWIANRFIGQIYNNREPREGRKPLFMWQQWGKSSQDTIRLILPYLVIKREQAELALTVRRFKNKVVGQRTMTDADFEANARIALRFRELNRRGTRGVA